MDDRPEELAKEIEQLLHQNAVLERQARHGRELKTALGGILPGHFHSPYPSPSDVKRQARQSWDELPRELPAIDLKVSEQLELLEVLKQFHDELNFPDRRTGGWRYYYHNDFFGYGDALVLAAMIRHLKPRRIIEAGSGFSSAVTLDTNERFFGNSIECTFVDPDFTRAHELLHPKDFERASFLQMELQDVPIATFASLAANDIVFIDSSHVSKVGSDVNYLFFEILPLLAAGVHVHFHDIFYPFEYRRDWIEQRHWAWTEAYLLRGFLEFNEAYEIRLFNHFLKLLHGDVLERTLPTMVARPACSIWLHRVNSVGRVAPGA
jgi:hypothetical protein